ncbi:hypothetical protein BG011_008141 [Mortierella polycephala]|uniref:Methyltransferase domain-containing protein n=1 Tax=Mortierella polycephala TaxID=41804 RepID=A0A9P6TWW9_9FUNG|nr:hypothetical protein BG011_008141 [Mortierella polycephala]
MGNSKSRHAHSGGFSRKHAKLSNTLQKQQQKHQQQQARNSSFGNNNNNMLTADTFPGQTVLNDSGHYSLYGSMTAPAIGQPEFTNGSYHTNLSKSGLIDQPIQVSDSRQQLQYGSRVKRATVIGSGDPGAGTIMTATNNNNNAYASNNPPPPLQSTLSNGDFMINNNGPIRNSGTPSRSVLMGISTGEVDGGGGAGAGVGGGRTGGYNANIAGKQEIMYQQQQQQQQQQLYEIDKRPSSAFRQTHGRISTFAHPSTPQQQYADPSVSTFQLYHQYHQYQHMSEAPPVPMGIHRGDDPSLTTMALGPVEGPIAGSRKLNGASQCQAQQTLRYQQQQQDYSEPSYGQRVPPFQGNSHTATNQQSRHTNSEARKRNNDFSYASNTNNNTATNSKQFTAGNGSAPLLHRTTENFVNAGLLVDTAAPSSAAANRLPASDQVFARLAKKYPTNPRETDKRERIYRWQDDVASAQTLNPNTDILGWIIPVVPDELDHPESPYYLDRITYELDLMAPLGKPIRKAIDINCGSGEWAMDIALKYPRAVVYALDPTLGTSRLPQRIPENCKFKLRDVKDQEGEFDLVHQRLGAFRIQIMEWTPHFAELGRLIKPGGWIQLAESNGMLVRGGVESRKVNRWVEKAALSSGLNPTQMVEALMPTMLGAGLINVECYEYGIPVGDWAGWRGDIAMQWYLSMLDSLRDEIIEMNRLEEGIFEETVELMKMECMAENAELVMKVICAQRPPLTDDLWR